jgi:TldD protein
LLKDLITSAHFPPNKSSEIRIQRNRTRSVLLRAGNLVSNSRNDLKGVNARVYDKGMYGFASANEISDDAIAHTVKCAGDNAHFLGERVHLNAKELPPIKKGEREPDKKMLDLPQKTYIDYLSGLNSIIEKRYDKLISNTLRVSCDSMEKIIRTSDGMNTHLVAPRAYVYVVLMAESKSGAPVDMFKALGGSGTFDKQFSSPELLIDELDTLYEKLMKKAEGIHADAGKKTCVLSGELTGMLSHEAVGHTVEADLVLGGSVARNLLNKQVASPIVNMVDFAHTALGKPTPLPIYVDDEGVEAKDALLIENGILRTYMVNRDLGSKLGIEPAGNARAYSFRDEPLIRMRNTAIVPGDSKLEDMISSLDDGYYLVSSGNGQADMTGEFMFGITEGYEIKNGKIGRALLETTVSGIAFEMLKTVSMVGDTMHWNSSGYCGKKQMISVGLGGPAIKCEISIGGR